LAVAGLTAMAMLVEVTGTEVLEPVKQGMFLVLALQLLDKEMLEELKRLVRICLLKGAVEEKERRERLAHYQMALLVALVVLVKIGKV
tara:strand:+ start:67 stop:330 length:264 start_codon:yes stop_codon:yes gene_type:complete